MDAIVKTVNNSSFMGKLLSEDLNILVIVNSNNMHYMIYKNNIIYVQKFNRDNINNIKEVDLLENLKDKTITISLIDGDELFGTLKGYYKDKLIVQADNITYEIYKNAIVAIIFK